MATLSSGPFYQQIADALRPRVPDWQVDGWPTVRAVAGEFEVSIMTASRALQALKEAQQPTPAPAADHWAVCLHVSPGPYRHAADQVTADGFRTVGRQTGGRMDLETVRLDDTPDRETVEARVRAAAAAGAGGLFLLPARVDAEAAGRDEWLLAAAAAAGLPVVLVERNLRGDRRPLTHDLVCFHDFDGGAALARHLFDAGRQRVGFVGGGSTSSHAERLGGYLVAAAAAGVAPVVVEQPAGPPRDAYRAVADRLLAAEVDAAICFHDHAAVGLVIELLRRGVRVPADVAVAGFSNMPIGESFSIGLTTYDFPAAAVAARAIDTMKWRKAHPDAPPVKLVVPGSLIVRDSTDPTAAAS